MSFTRRSVLVGGAIVTSGCGQASEPSTQPPQPAAEDPRPRVYSHLNQTASDFELPKLGGGTAHLSDYAGKTLILSFGGLWCPDCILDGPYLSHLAQLAAASNDVAFLDIHTRNRFGKWGPNERERTGQTSYNVDESAVALNAYFQETGHSYPVAFDVTRTWAREAYGIEWYPTYVIVGRNGVIQRWRTDLFDRASTESFFAEARELG